MTTTFDEAAVKHMVDRFLTWKFPTTISPDGGLSFEPTFNKGTQHERRREPVGTNLLSATEATQMVLHMLEGLDLVRDADPLPDADGTPAGTFASMAGAQTTTDSNFAEALSENRGDLYLRPAPSGPVVEETVKRIVPGVYGIVEVALVAEARVGSQTLTRVSIVADTYSSTDILAAAEILRQIGEAMEGK